jgi:malate dehydrogenase
MATKVGLIGAGHVGATAAFCLATQNICDEIVVKDIREDFVQGVCLDISQAANALHSNTLVKSCKDPKDFSGCDIIIIAAGVPRKPGMSRDDLLFTNVKIMESILDEIQEYTQDTVFIFATNPLDAIVYAALKKLQIDRSKVIGMAGVLDSARMSYFIQEKLEDKKVKIDVKVMGGHGDDMVPLINHSYVDGIALDEVFDRKTLDEIIDKTRFGGAQIVSFLGNGSAYYAPGLSIAIMVKAILSDSKKSLPCAVLLNGEYGYRDVVAGVPVILGKNGMEKIEEIYLKPEQLSAFDKSIFSVKSLIDKL